LKFKERQKRHRRDTNDGALSMYNTLQFKITGAVPLLLHSGQMADPLNPLAKQMKAVSGKKKKTDADHEEMSRIEFIASLYVDEKGTPCIPGENIEAMLVTYGSSVRQKKHFSTILSDGTWALEYDGPKSTDGLWSQGARFIDKRAVRVQNARVMRTRPKFRQWSLTFNVSYLPELLNKDAVVLAVETCGRIIGLGDYRPKYGRFHVTEVKEL
jgi:hypothetical protein